MVIQKFALNSSVHMCAEVSDETRSTNLNEEEIAR